MSSAYSRTTSLAHPYAIAPARSFTGTHIPAKGDRPPPRVVQTDTMRDGGEFMKLPKTASGRVTTDDFVFFRWPSSIHPNDYVVAMDTMDTTQPMRQIGDLEATKELPNVILDAHAHIYVIPKTNPNLPRFYARLSRANTYILPEVFKNHVPGVRYQMQRYGMPTGAVAGNEYSVIS